MTSAQLLNLNSLISIVALVMLVVLATAIAHARSLLTVVLLLAVYSLLTAVWLLMMDAADVAFTEAVVGAGVSTMVYLGAILLGRSETPHVDWRSKIAPAIVCAVAGVLLLYPVSALPVFGDPASPANSHVGRWYLEHSAQDVGVPNVVTAVLASYRGIDTLGETTVVFAAGLAVALLLGFGERALSDSVGTTSAASPETSVSGGSHAVLRVMAKLLIPLIALYALYVQFHGEVSAGGGFQAGMIIATAVILHALVFGLRATMEAIPPVYVRGMAALGVLLFSGVGVVNLVNGGRFLDYDHVFPLAMEHSLPGSVATGGHHHWGQHFGIIGVELGVLLTVAATIVSIYYGFAGRALESLIAVEGKR